MFCAPLELMASLRGSSPEMDTSTIYFHQWEPTYDIANLPLTIINIQTHASSTRSSQVVSHQSIALAQWSNGNWCIHQRGTAAGFEKNLVLSFSSSRYLVF